MIALKISCFPAFKTVFMEFDHDQDGLLLPDQLTEALRYLRIDVNSQVLKDIMSFLKITGDVMEGGYTMYH